MSGGVDSSVAAALLKEQGHEVVGVFMRLGSPGETLDELQPFDSEQVSCDPAKLKIGHQGCCSINDAADARLVAAHLGIPLYVCNFKKDFGRIIDYFVDEYAQGRTPNPCVRCNDWLKFGKLHDYANQIGAEAVASGHYARVVRPSDEPRTTPQMSAANLPGTRPSKPHDTPTPQMSNANLPGPSHTAPYLARGVDHTKDQSYVLFGVPRPRLNDMLLPVGSFTKSQIREMARERNLPVFDKPDSQEICFVPDNDYAGLVERRRPDLASSEPGTVTDTEGNVLGSHEGQHRFTIGQRRGVGVALGHPIYVVDKDPKTNTVTVGSREDLQSTGLLARETNWIDPSADHPPADWTDAMVQYRYNSKAIPARVRAAADTDEPTPSGRPGRFEVRFNDPVHAVAPGQAAVVYDADDPDRVLGGGWIERATRD